MIGRILFDSIKKRAEILSSSIIVFSRIVRFNRKPEKPIQKSRKVTGNTKLNELQNINSALIINAIKIIKNTTSMRDRAMIPSILDIMILFLVFT